MAWGKQSSHQRGYGAQWRRLREQVMQRDCGLCQVCMSKGLTRMATEVDHIVPKSDGGTDDMHNLQAICGGKNSCHEAKTFAEQGKRVPQSIGTDGWPI